MRSPRETMIPHLAGKCKGLLLSPGKKGALPVFFAKSGKRIDNFPVGTV